MIVPGSNLLAIALSVQGTQAVLWAQDVGRITNVVGKDVTDYAFPVAVTGSFQPKSRAWAALNGLDIQKAYALFYASQPMKPVSRGISGDQFAYGGSLWHAMNDTDWFHQDGWNAELLVRVGPYVG